MDIVVCYIVYLLISVTTTIWVATTLRRNGRTFLVDAFHGDDRLADSVNHLRVVGFCLVNVGYITLALRTTATVANTRAGIEPVCGKIGLVLMVLGGMHFLNLYVFNRLRKRGETEPPQRDSRTPVPSRA